MRRQAGLRSEDREFLGRLAEVVFANPFATEASRIRALIGRAPRPAPGSHALAAIGPALDARLRAIASRGVATLGAVADAGDRRLLECGYLFEAYDRFVDPFDALIRSQIEAGDRPADVPFAGALIAHLSSRGFSDDDAARLIALFYQIRRAYYFIARALVGDSPSMKSLRRALWDNVFTSDILAYRDHLWSRMEDFSTLLLGETGSGKGTAAAAIGRSGLIPFDRRAARFSASFTGTFIAINLSQFPETLIESELFGHRKGAFTGAIDDHHGIFERCSPHGSLFLDEIGDLSVHVQLKLLNVIEERRFSPVGGRSRIRFEGRVIAATNRPLDALRREGRFRDDLFYRLCSDVIEVPPLRQRLRERPAELDQLVRLLLARMTGGEDATLARKVLDRLRRDLPADHPWPGNVRELEQAVRRILLTGSSPARPAAPRDPGGWWAEAVRDGRLTAAEVLQRYCRMLYERHGTYEEVARLTALDRRTVRKYVGAPVRRGPAGR